MYKTISFTAASNNDIIVIYSASSVVAIEEITCVASVTSAYSVELQSYRNDPPYYHPVATGIYPGEGI